TDQPGEPILVDGHVGHQSVWFNWTAPSTGTLEADTSGSSIETLLGVFTGNDVASLTRVGSSWYTDSRGNGTSRVHIPVVEGITYHFAIDGDLLATGPLHLNWSLDAPPANDSFSTPTD